MDRVIQQSTGPMARSRRRVIYDVLDVCSILVVFFSTGHAAVGPSHSPFGYTRIFLLPQVRVYTHIFMVARLAIASSTLVLYRVVSRGFFFFYQTDRGRLTRQPYTAVVRRPPRARRRFALTRNGLPIDNRHAFGKSECFRKRRCGRPPSRTGGEIPKVPPSRTRGRIARWLPVHAPYGRRSRVTCGRPTDALRNTYRFKGIRNRPLFTAKRPIFPRSHAPNDPETFKNVFGQNENC